MSWMRRRAMAGLLLVALMGSLCLAGFAPHTDDGCQTEIHCLACRSAYTRVSVVTPAHGPAIGLAPVGAAPTAAPAAVADGAPSVIASRGPPLSS
jgi:hypothetical protein